MVFLDNVPGYPKEEELNPENKQIQVLYLLLNTTPLLQPMDHNVIQQTKINLKKSIPFGYKRWINNFF